jgi:tryptophan-rich sensory protein
MIIRLLLFLVINFAALGLGSLLMGAGPASDWYQNLNKAPWTPPGWVFGAAWTLIMLCFAVYMAYGWERINNRNTLLILFTAQWILNVMWNPVFFRYHQVLPGLLVIAALTLLVGYMFFSYFQQLKTMSLLILPYLIWLLIATSLNGYIYIRN